jgi:hypothetical protein
MQFLSKYPHITTKAYRVNVSETKDQPRNTSFEKQGAPAGSTTVRMSRVQALFDLVLQGLDGGLSLSELVGIICFLRSSSTIRPPAQPAPPDQ